MLACLQYLLIGGAIVVGVCGIVESVCAGYFIYQLYEYSSLAPSNVCGSAITLVVIGLITAAIGWCTWQFLDFTNGGQVIIFSIALTIVIIVNASAGIWALVRHEQVVALPNVDLDQIFERALSEDKALWDHMHSQLHCCGIYGPSDFSKQDAVPWSCCDISMVTNSSDNKGVCTTLYAHGCQHAVLNRTKSILLHIFLLALSSVLLQICFITCISCYARACRERMKRIKERVIAAETLARASKGEITPDQNLLKQSKNRTSIDF